MHHPLWVLIAAAGKADLLARTLRSLASCLKPPGYCGTIVVENGPRCGIEAVVHEAVADLKARYRYVAQANKSHALNCALAELDEGLVIMTDDDVRFDSQVLLAYAQAAEGRSRGRFFGGPVLVDAEQGRPPAWLVPYYPHTIASAWLLPYAQRTEVPGRTFMGTNWAAFVADLKAIGGFDTRIGPGGTTGATGQETEAQRRLIAAGGRGVYVPDALAWHYLHREFLDPVWVLRRAYRHGLEWGIRRTRGRKRAAWPMLRGVLGRLNAEVKAAVWRLSGGEERRFAAEFHQAKWRGRWDGLLLGRRWDELPQLVPPALPPSLGKAA